MTKDVFGPDRRVSIQVGGKGTTASVVVNGADIAPAVRRVDFTAIAGDHPTVVLDLVVFRGIEAECESATVLMSTATRTLLLDAGWIPPAGEEA